MVMNDKINNINDTSDVCFEEALGKLEVIVKLLEKGELKLEDSLDKFAQGVALSQLCLAKLTVAEKKIDKILQKEQGIIVEKPLLFNEEKSKC